MSVDAAVFSLNVARRPLVTSAQDENGNEI